MDPASRSHRTQFNRIVVFIGVLSAILLLTSWFVCATWNRFWGMTGANYWELIFPALSVTFVAATVLARRFSNFVLRLAYWLAATWIGFLNYCFFAAVACWIVFALAALLSFHVDLRMVAGVFFGAASATTFYGYLNASRVRVTNYTVGLAALPPQWRGRNIAVVTDLHLGNVRGAAFSREVVARLRQLQAHAILIVGDLFDGTRGDLDAMVEPWNDISAPGGIYYVTGNHEEFESHDVYVAAVGRGGIRVLENEMAEVEGLQFVGVFDAELHDPRYFGELLRQMKLNPSRPGILLAHQPVNLAVAEEQGISLQVCGHTHSGQFWPWMYVAARVHGQYNEGLHRWGKMWVLTSNGVGTWGPPVRVGTKSEILLVRLDSAEAAPAN